MNGHSIVIPEMVYDKIMYWIDKANFEVSGFGTVIHDPNAKTFTIEDAFLIKQEGSAAATDICAKDLGKAMFMAHKMQLKGTINFWWHSHVNMDVFWSGTDKSTIEDLGKNGYILATVFNKKYGYRSAFAANVNVPFLGPRTELIDNFPTTITKDLESSLIEQWDKDFKDNVVEKTYKVPDYTANDWSEYGRWWDKEESDKGPAANKRTREYEWEPDTPEQKRIARAEAKALGLSYDKYLNVLNYGSHDDLEAIDKKLLEKGYDIYGTN